MAEVHQFGPRVGGRLALFCIHGVRHPCRDFMDMLRRLINCRIIIIIIIIIQELTDYSC